MPTERQIVDAYTRRALLLLRVARGIAADNDKELRALANDLRAAIVGADLSALGRRDLSALLRTLGDAIEARYAAISIHSAASLAQLAAIESAWATRVGELSRPAGAGAIDVAASDALVLGLPAVRHWERQASNLSDRVAATLRTAIATTLPAADLIASIVGAGPRGRERGGLMEGARQQAETLADTTAHAVAYAGRVAAWKAGGVNALKWHSILDSRTTINCATRSGKLYDLDFQPVGHDIPMGTPPPAHWNCRSILVGMKYPDGQIPADGQDPYSESLDAWLKRQPEAAQDELLGPTRAAMWRAGALDTRGLLGRGGETLSVRALVDMRITPETQIALWWARPRGDLVAVRVPDELQSAMAASSNEAILTSYFRKKQLANHPEMDTEVYTRLPSLLGNPAVAVRQGRNDVLVIDDDGRKLLVVMRPDSVGRILVRSVHYIREREFSKLRDLQPIFGEWD